MTSILFFSHLEIGPDLRVHRRQWADYFDQQGVRYAFFSAANATALQQARREAQAALAESSPELDPEEVKPDQSAAESEPSTGQELEKQDDDLEDEEEEWEDDDNSSLSSAHDGRHLVEEDDSPDAQDPRTRVLSVLELEQLFINAAPDLSSTLLNFFFPSFSNSLL